jgi:trypsin-like peptidase
MRAVGILLLAVAVGRGAAAQEPAAVAGSVIRVGVVTEDGQRQGAGFVVDADGTIVTTFDVIRRADAVVVILPNGETRGPVRLLLADDRRNIAVLKVDGVALPPAALGNSEGVRVGDSLLTVLPSGEGTVPASVSGRRQMGGFHWLQLSTPSPTRASGGPVVDARGEVVGVVVIQGRRGRERAFAVPINYIRDLLPRARGQTGRVFGEVTVTGGAAAPVATPGNNPPPPIQVLAPVVDSAERLRQVGAAVAALKPSQPVLVHTGGEGRLAGPLVRADDGSLVLGPYLGYAESDTAVALSRIDSLWVRGTQSRLYAIIGAGFGAVVGVILYNASTELCVQGGRRTICPGAVAVGGLGGAAVGGVTGWLIGSAAPRWRLVVPRRP